MNFACLLERVVGCFRLHVDVSEWINSLQSLWVCFNETVDDDRISTCYDENGFKCEYRLVHYTRSTYNPSIYTSM